MDTWTRTPEEAAAPGTKRTDNEEFRMERLQYIAGTPEADRPVRAHLPGVLDHQGLRRAAPGSDPARSGRGAGASRRPGLLTLPHRLPQRTLVTVTVTVTTARRAVVPASTSTSRACLPEVRPGLRWAWNVGPASGWCRRPVRCGIARGGAGCGSAQLMAFSIAPSTWSAALRWPRALGWTKDSWSGRVTKPSTHLVSSQTL